MKKYVIIMALAIALLILLKAVFGLPIGIFDGVLIVNLFYGIYLVKKVYPRLASILNWSLLTLTTFWFLGVNLPMTKAHFPYDVMWLDNTLASITNPTAVSYKKVVMSARDSVGKEMIKEVKVLLGQNKPTEADSVYKAFVKKWGPDTKEEEKAVKALIPIPSPAPRDSASNPGSSANNGNGGVFIRELASGEETEWFTLPDCSTYDINGQTTTNQNRKLKISYSDGTYKVISDKQKNNLLPQKKGGVRMKVTSLNEEQTTVTIKISKIG